MQSVNAFCKVFGKIFKICVLQSIIETRKGGSTDVWEKIA